MVNRHQAIRHRPGRESIDTDAVSVLERFVPETTGSREWRRAQGVLESVRHGMDGDVVRVGVKVDFDPGGPRCQLSLDEAGTIVEHGGHAGHELRETPPYRDGDDV